MRSNKVLVAAVAVLLALAGGVVLAVTDSDDEPARSLAVDVDDPAGVDARGGAVTSDVDLDDPDVRGPPDGANDVDSSARAVDAGDPDEGAVDGEFDEGFGAGGEARTQVDGDFDGGAQAVRYSDLPTISVFDLPSEAIDTLDRIERGGPYPYAQDDGVFQNRERILPARELGHYREYTVETPGSRDRGARRIVAGDDGERYWTDDHYASFREVVFE